MNRQIRYFLLVLMTALLLAACRGTEASPPPEPAIEDGSTSLPEPVLVSDPTEQAPTAVPPGSAGAGQFSKFIGLVYPPSPAGLTQVFSMLMEGRNDFSLMMVLDGAEKMLWLSRISRYGEDGGAYWEVMDVLGLSDLEAGLTLIPDGCALDGTPDSELLAAGRNGVVVLAWRANTTLGRFESMPVSGIRCNSDKTMPLE